LNKEYSILATFFHEYSYGKVIGGVERRFVELSKAFTKKGIKVYAIEYEPSIGRNFNAEYISIAIDRPRPKGPFSELVKIFKLSLHVLIACRRHQCKILYATSSVYLNVLPAYIASRLCRLPLVIVFHSYPYGKMENPLISLKSHIQKGNSVMSGFVKVIIEYLRNSAYRSACICFTVSNSTRTDLLRAFRPKRIITSGNGISNEWFVELNREKKYDACYVGRLSPRKGIDFLLHVWKQVVQEKPEATLLIIGGGESQTYIDTCKKITKELGLTKNVVFTGFLDDEVLRSYLSSSRLFITTSSREGFGLTIVEAMALRVPCILPTLPSLRENFSRCAILVDGRDPKKWADVILSCLNDGKLLAELSSSGYELSRQYSWKAVADAESSEMIKLIISNHI
jgi:glycosyltransferase involved in cell wall biosynthesis